jgi:hypothetical protein
VSGCAHHQREGWAQVDYVSISRDSRSTQCWQIQIPKAIRGSKFRSRTNWPRACAKAKDSGKPERLFKELRYQTLTAGLTSGASWPGRSTFPNLSTGFHWAVPEGVPVVLGDVGDEALITEVLKDRRLMARRS